MTYFHFFGIASLHHRWNGSKLLSPETVSRVAERDKIYDFRELGNFRKISKLAENMCKLATA